MGKINQGILGGFSGRVGTVVGGTWKSINYMRALATSVNNPNTLKQQSQRTKFAMTLNFLHSVVPYVRIGYKSYAIHQSAHNAAMSYIMQNAISGEGLNLAVDYQRVQLSRGHLMSVYNANVSVSGNAATFTWTNNSGTADARDTDVAMPLVYNKVKQQAQFDTATATRGDGQIELTLPADWSGDALAVYLGFRTENGENCSDSICLKNDAYDGSGSPTSGSDTEGGGSTGGGGSSSGGGDDGGGDSIG